MRLHANATTCPKSRLLLCRRVIEQGWSRTEAAAAAGTSERTASKWLARYRTEGLDGLIDRPSTPTTNPTRVTGDRIATIAGLRHLRMTAAEIAECLSMPASTVSAVLGRIGLGKRSALEPFEPPNRYERRHPGELVHIDIKKLGMIGRPGKRMLGEGAARKTRGAGWEFVHVAVDDATRLAYVEVLENEKASTSIGFLRRAVRFFDGYGVRVQRVMTDNGSAYRSAAHALACRRLGIRHLRTRPYRPRTNGKAERFIRTLLGGWAYGAIYGTSRERTAALDGWLWHYNHRRRHSALGHQTPATRLNNLLGSYT